MQSVGFLNEDVINIWYAYIYYDEKVVSFGIGWSLFQVMIKIQKGIELVQNKEEKHEDI